MPCVTATELNEAARTYLETHTQGAPASAESGAPPAIVIKGLPPLIHAEQVSLLSGEVLSVWSVRRLARDGTIPCRRMGRRLLFATSEILPLFGLSEPAK